MGTGTRFYDRSYRYIFTGHNLSISVNDRVILPLQVGFIYEEISEFTVMRCVTLELMKICGSLTAQSKKSSPS